MATNDFFRRHRFVYYLFWGAEWKKLCALLIHEYKNAIGAVKLDKGHREILMTSKCLQPHFPVNIYSTDIRMLFSMPARRRRWGGTHILSNNLDLSHYTNPCEAHRWRHTYSSIARRNKWLLFRCQRRTTCSNGLLSIFAGKPLTQPGYMRMSKYLRFT